MLMYVHKARLIIMERTFTTKLRGWGQVKKAPATSGVKADPDLDSGPTES